MNGEELRRRGLLETAAQPPQSNEPPKKTLAKESRTQYNSPVGSLACQLKEVTVNMASHKTVKGKLYDDNGTWTVRARVFDPATGTVIQRSKSTGFKVRDSTKRKAEQAMREIVAGWEQEANTAPVKSDPLFSEYVQKWIEKKSVSLRENTVKSYRDYADTHILPAFGGMKVRQMTLKHLQVYYKDKLEYLSVNSLKKHHVVISGALLDAVRDGIIPVNFADYVEFPKAEKFEGKAYSAEQVAALLDAVAREGEPIRAAVTLAVCYGLRREEICGLRWKDVDFEAGKLYVRNTVTQNGTLRIEAERTKTDKSRRTIDLIASTIPYLEQLKQLQQRQGLVLDKVCVWLDGRTVRPDYITSKTRRVMKAHGLEHVRVHDLRHTAASLLATRATPKQVQDFLGHEDISTTMNIYTHLLDEDRKATSGIMNDILKKSVFCSEKCSERKSAEN